VSLLRGKQDHNDVLSTTTIFIAAVEWGRLAEAEPRAPAPLVGLAKLVTSTNNDGYEVLKHEFFGETVPSISFVLTEETLHTGLRLSDTVTNVWDEILSRARKSDRLVTAMDLMLGLFGDASAPGFASVYFGKRLSLLEVSPTQIAEVLKGNQSAGSETEALEETEVGPTAPSDETPIWLCQYRRSEERTLESRLAPGVNVDWRINPYKARDLQSQMNSGDTVVLWRAIDKTKPEGEEKSRGGIVGWGKIERVPAEGGAEGITFTVTDAFQHEPLPRDDVLQALGQPGKNWPGQRSLKRLDAAEARVFRAYQPTPQQPEFGEVQERHQTELASDRAETTRDLLGRAPLAFTLAHHINRIWEEQTRSENGAGRESAPDEAAFILHIDSPWGGGKTTFANFVSRILNPEAHGLVPPWGGGETTSADFVSRFLSPGARGLALPWRDDEEHSAKNEPEGEDGKRKCNATKGAKQDNKTLFDELRMGNEAYWKREYRERKWIPVTFNAWQNQHVNPPWWNFYESIRKQCLDSLPPLERWWNRIKEWAWRVFSPEFVRTSIVVGLLAVLVVVLWSFDILTLPQRAGASGGTGTSIFTHGTFSALFVLVLTGGSGFALIRAFQSGLSKIVDSAGKSADAGTLGEADPIMRFRRRFSKVMKDYKRPILVIVDDLDRCEPNYVVELVRGMLTIFRSPRVVFLLLGDKTWIETSFAKVHEDMAAAHTDEEITFGERFAEKAIQLSLILPEPEKDLRDAYIEHLLRDEAAGKVQTPVPTTPDTARANAGSQGEAASRRKGIPSAEREELEERVEGFEERVMDRYGKAETDAEMEEVRDWAEKEVAVSFADWSEAARRADKVMNFGEMLRAASSEHTDQSIRHGLSDLKNELPGNPRRIKRIINMVAIYQASAQSVRRTRRGSNEWRQLVLWVILMSEHPEAWRILSANPDFADLVVKNNTVESEEEPRTDSDGPSRADLFATVNQEGIARLIKGESFKDAVVRIDTKAVGWLSRLTPIA